MPVTRLVPNGDGTYDIYLEYSRFDVEFANEFDVKKDILSNSRRILHTVRHYADTVKIKSVRIFVSSILIASVAFSTFLSIFAAVDRYSMAYVYGGTEQQQVQYVDRTNNALDTVSPNYFTLNQDGTLKLTVSRSFVSSMHQKGIRVVPFLSNHWDRTAGVNALKNVESLSTQIANYVASYDLDGINVDIENVTQDQRDQYTQFVRLLRQKIPANKEVSVAVAANPNNWQTGWHGSYDYTALAKYADHLFIMAYDEHYEGSSPGPVASIDFVERSIKYALSKTSADKIVVGIPFYGRVWSLDNNQIVGKGISINMVQQILKNCQSTVTYDEKTQSVKAQFKITSSSPTYTVGGGTVLQPGNYVVWYENDKSYQQKLNLVNKYNLKGAGSWSLGQEDPSIWSQYEDWLDGESAGDGVTLDTSRVNMIQGVSLYDFLVKKNNDTANISVSSSNEKVASVALQDGRDVRGAKYRIAAGEAGKATITVRYNGKVSTLDVAVYPRGGSITLDTVSYRMAPGGIYDIGVTITDGKGTPLSSAQVQQMYRNGTLRVTDSRTGSIVSLKQLPNGNFRVTGRNPGTCYIQYEIIQNGQAVTRASVRIDVQKGAIAGGAATRNTSWWADKS